MLDMLTVAHDNVKEHNEYYAIRVSPNGRYSYVLIMGGLFLSVFSAEIAVIYKTWTDADYNSALTMHVLFSITALLFGYLAFSNLKSLFQLNEVLLVPEERKIILRRERSKKVVSEHSVDDIEINRERVMWEDNMQSSKWFTLYDKRLQKQIFSIRPGEKQSDDAPACRELEEFYRTVMNPGHTKSDSES